MKTNILLLLLLLNGVQSFAQCNGVSIPITSKEKATSIGIIIYSNDTETVWNALRFANFSKTEGDTVQIFLLGKGVEVEKLTEQNKDIKEQVDLLLKNGGTILGCGTCLQSRNNNEPKVCKFSSMADLYALVRKNKIIVTF